ncbi:Antirestriction protein ArdC [Zunongwangia mangrovi]|uniref:Antirestriction protein ArdC n=1 Tax=Zunongwangia mangrovi TaxID=1334022 RepID=A0A1I1DJ55_9FLAO|nr:zincin-like metallopeptidase domain-containing protein [Zunongwangia mangrovi]SFB72553.1 Antirestriction protein ArdC [Zunongwangia mangrovi]
MIINAVQAFNNLNGKIVSREELKTIAILATDQGQHSITKKIDQLLNSEQDLEFKITIGSREIERLPEDCLCGIDQEIPQMEFEGLGKAVSPDDIYQMITDKMIEQIEAASGEGYKTKWRKEGYLIPFNFSTRKPYRGINAMMLTDFAMGSFENPFFLTFNQIEKHKGKIKKGAKAAKVVYFTQLYKYEQAEPELEYGTYNRLKMISWLKKNRKDIKLLEKFSPESITDQNAIPILKYYNVFNGSDIEDIDFDLENFKIGYYNNGIKGNDDSRLEIAEAIFKSFPTPAPKLKHEPGRAYYNFVDDFISMPEFKDFDTGLDYYRTLFHEMTHSTGFEERLNRKVKNRFGSKAYAKEELIAEFGAVFLSAQAGIIWRNQSNHAEYIKNWQNALPHLKKDNRLLMRSASAAQKATDFILNYDKEGIPKFHKELENLKNSKPEKKAKNKSEEQLSLFEGLNAPAPEKFKSIKEFANFAYNWAKANLTGKKYEHNEIGETVHFTNAGIYHAIRSRRTKLKVQLIFKAMEMLKNSTLIKFEKDKKKRAEIAGVYRMKSYAVIDKFPYEVVLTLRKGENGTVYYDHKAIEAKRLTIDAESEKSQSAVNSKPFIKDKENNSSGLNAPENTETELAVLDDQEPEVLQTLPQPVQKEETAMVHKAEVIQPQEAKPEPISRQKNPKSRAARREQLKNKTFRYYNIPNQEIAKFLGNVEIKDEESVGISITAPQGAGKTRFLFQVINAFAKNYKVGHASMEEHPDSSLYLKKEDQYIDPENLHNIEAPVINTMEDLHALIMRNDIIAIDSFEKLREIQKDVQVDKDFRKKYDSKLFIFIFQLTSDGNMRGGSKSQFDVDIVLFTEKFEDYRENFIYTNKNRYNELPETDLKYSIFKQQMLLPEGREKNQENKDVSDINFEEVESFEVGSDSGSSSEIIVTAY